MKTLEQKISALERELKFRRSLYPRWIAAKKISESDARHQIECFEEILEDLKKQKQNTQQGLLL